LLVDKLMRIFPIKTSNRWLGHLVLPRLHHRIRKLADSPADVLAVIVIFRLSNPSKIQTRTIRRRRLLRIFEGSERPKVIILLNQC